MRQITSDVCSRCGKVYHQRRTGFTLVELLVVIAIIALLMGILMPALNIAQKKAMYAICKSGFHQIGLATLMYSEENRYRLPAGFFFNYPNANPGDTSNNGICYEPGIDEGFLATDVQPYLGSSSVLSTDFSIFICPADKQTREQPAFYEGVTAQYGSIASTQGANTEEWYKSGHLNHYGPSNHNSYYIYYYYFGNYPGSVTGKNPSWKEEELFGEREIKLRIQGFRYPRSSTGPRAKLMQDIATPPQMNYFGLISSHEEYNPNGLFTDGSVEALARSKLSLHFRQAGLGINHFW